MVVVDDVVAVVVVHDFVDAVVDSGVGGTVVPIQD